MPDEIIQSVKVDTKSAVEALEELGVEYNKTAKSAEDAGEQFAFTNEQLMAETSKYNQITEQAALASKNLAQAKKAVTVATVESTEASAAANVQGGALLGTLSKQRIAFQDVGRVITGQGFSLRSLSSNFALLGPAVTIGAAAIGLIGYELYKYINNAATAENATRELTETISKSLSDEIGNTEILVATIKSSNTTQAERKKIVQQLIEQHPNYFKNLQEEDGITKNLDVDTKKFIQALQEEAKIKAASAKITELTGEQLEEEFKYKDQLAVLEKSRDAALAKGNQASAKIEQEGIDRLKERYNELQKEIDIYSQLGAVAEQTQTKLGGDTGKPVVDKKKQHDESLAEERKYVEDSQKIEDDAEQKAVVSENEKYEKIKAALEAAHHSTEELTRQHIANLESIGNEFAEKRFNAAQAAHAKREQEMKDEELKAQQHLQTIENAISSHYQKDESIGASAREKALNESNEFFEKEKTALAGHEKEIEALVKLHNAELADINKKFDDQEAAEENKKDQEALKKIDEIANRDQRTRIEELQSKKSNLDEAQALLDSYYDKGALTDAQYTQKTIALSKARQQINAEERSAYAGYADEIGNTLTKIGSALGKQTAAGKDFAIAGATIAAISSAVKAYDAMAGIPIIGPALGAVAAAAALAAGLENVKKIEATKVPGSGGGGSSSSSSTGSISSASGGGGVAPSLPGSTSTTRIAPQSINQMNSSRSGNEPLQAYVVESQVTGAQQTRANNRTNSTI